MIAGGISAFAGRRVLLLQGPVGPFFRRLARDLCQVGAEIHKVNFNGGDWLFFPDKGSISFRGSIEEWPTFFEDLLDRLNIDVVLLFGDCRLYHRRAHAIATERGIDVGVFEEGYLRPDWITLELFGVNGHSRIPRDPYFYRSLTQQPSPVPQHRVDKAFRITALWAFIYYLAGIVLKPFYPHYQHHRPFTPWEALPWIRSGWRKLYFAVREYGLLSTLVSEHSKDYFLVPLQVHNDSQVCVHSPYADVSEFIREVVCSFAANGPGKTALVIKHHPRDRGYHDYTALISELRRRYNLGQRLIYLHDLHLPTLLDHALGAVVINSTVGLSALHHGVPTKTTGNAFYDMEGLTFQGSLDEFWGKAWVAVPSVDLFTRFKTYLQSCVLINGSFYRRLPASRLKSGILWPHDSHWLSIEPTPKEEVGPHTPEVACRMEAVHLNPLDQYCTIDPARTH